MTIEEMADHSGIADCAELLVRDEGLIGRVAVYRAIALEFDGDADAFEVWAKEFLREGYGCKG